MLGGALFSVAVVALAAATFLTAGLAMTRISIARTAQRYAAAGYQRAADALQQRIAAQMQQGGLPDPLPAFTPLPASCADAGSPCRYTVAETIEVTQSAAPVSAPACDPSQTNCARNEQANPYVREGRLAARITVTVAAAGGTVLAQRASDVIVRLLATPPYAVLGGSREATFDASTATAGDDGGAAAATPNPCASASAASGTAVRVAYQNAITGACSDGSSWSDGSYTISGDAPSGWQP